ncbi:hypothetical protein [Neotamlana nanhaiensis]|nr:hypothetical protein [Tamlana nanhaiensis]
MSFLSVTLIVVGLFFATLLVLGVLKSYKLKKENDRLEALNNAAEEESEKPYRDFTEGHLYGGNHQEPKKG